MTTQPKKTQHETPDSITSHGSVPPKGHRQCFITREVKPTHDLIRFVVNPDTHDLVPDYNRKLPGRGLWLSIDAEIMQQGLQAGALKKALKGKTVTVPDDVADHLHRQINDQIYATMSLMRRSGDLVSGFEKIMSALPKTPVGAYITTAQNGSDKIRSKLPESVKMLVLDDKERLDRIMNHENTTHIIAKRGDLCLKLLQHSETLTITRRLGT